MRGGGGGGVKVSNCHCSWGVKLLFERFFRGVGRNKRSVPYSREDTEYLLQIVNPTSNMSGRKKNFSFFNK